MAGLIDTLLMNTATPIDEEYTDVSFCLHGEATRARRARSTSPRP